MGLVKVVTSIHLKSGEVINSKEETMTLEELNGHKRALSKVMANESWQLNIELPDGSWSITPASAVSWVGLKTEEY